MGKVININELRNMVLNRGNELEYSIIKAYADMLVIQSYILWKLYEETNCFLKEVNFPVKSFALVDESARAFLSADLVEAFKGGEALFISYIATIDDVEYRTLAAALIKGETADIIVSLFKKSGKEWLIYAGEDKWNQAPGADFF